jgi:2'-5' RNA ligase
MSERRVFFALWPDASVRERLDGIARLNQLPGTRPIKAANLHATLNFIGNLPEQRLSALIAAAGAVSAQRFVLELTMLEVWRRSAVLALCPETVPGALLQLHADLDRRLIEAGFETEKRAYRPHVTLARKARAKMSPWRLDSTLHWSVDAFSLVESVPVEGGVRYDVLQQWSLT